MIKPEIYQLDLPRPTDHLLDAVKNYVLTVELNQSNKDWLDQFHSNTINSALHQFSTDQEITKLLKEQYAEFFSDLEIRSVIGIMKSHIARQ